LSHQNPFIGQSMGSCSADFATRYKVGIISTRSRGQGQQSDPPAATGEPSETASDQPSDRDVESDAADTDAADADAGLGLNSGFLHFDTRSIVLATGDVVLSLAKSSDIDDLKANKDFFVASTVGSVPPVMSYYGMVPVGIFLVMIILVATELLRMCPAALCAVGILFLGGWLKPAEIPKMIDVRLLMLMGCSLSFAQSIQSSGLAGTMARSVIKALDPSPRGALYIVYILTLIVTETMSNNAAAAIMYPLASAVAKELGVSVIPFALTVLIAATAAFMSPIAYQTHLMVWAPGGYTFMDFVKFGLFADILFWQVSCAIAPVLFPL
jgi:di/tricarboxylate transporter